MEDFLYFIPLFFLISLIYSSIGFGGGSSYIAVMAIFGLPFSLIPKTALLCNIVVVSGGCYTFFRLNNIDFMRVKNFVIGSVPLAYLGGMIQVNKEIFLFTLSISLIVTSIIMFFFSIEKKRKLKIDFIQNRLTEHYSSFITKTSFFEIFIGGGLGFISGIVGIGGGIFLAPLLYLTRWGDAKQIAAASSFFILINSMSGLFGQFSKGSSGYELLNILPFIIAVLIGGQIGSQIGAFKLSERFLENITGTMVLFVGIQILTKAVV